MRKRKVDHYCRRMWHQTPLPWTWSEYPFSPLRCKKIGTVKAPAWSEFQGNKKKHMSSCRPVDAGIPLVRFQSLGLRLKSGDKQVVLEGVTGSALHGTMTAVMGPRLCRARNGNPCLSILLADLVPKWAMGSQTEGLLCSLAQWCRQDYLPVYIMWEGQLWCSDWSSADQWSRGQDPAISQGGGICPTGRYHAQRS